MASLLERMIGANAERDPERLLLKYQAIAESPCAFYRGTPFLFYEALAKVAPAIPRDPRAWLCGDAHLENFGVYKGENRLVYFDSNDFDEAALGPCWWDILRLSGSLLLRGAAKEELERLWKVYTDALGNGKAAWMERALASGFVRRRMLALKWRKRRDLLNGRTRLNKKGRRVLLLDGQHALPLQPATNADPGLKEELALLLKQIGKACGDKKFFRLLSAARRVAGNSSLGIERYVMLVEGKGSPDGNYLLDLKQARPSVVAQNCKIKQPPWSDDAQRICWIQKQFQAISPAFLEPVLFRGAPYVLRELMPREDRVRLKDLGAKREDMLALASEEARVVAWGQLRASGRKGSATAEELQSFAQDPAWTEAAIDWATGFAEQVKTDWAEFRQADLPALVAGKVEAARGAKNGRR